MNQIRSLCIAFTLSNKYLKLIFILSLTLNSKKSSSSHKKSIDSNVTCRKGFHFIFIPCMLFWMKDLSWEIYINVDVCWQNLKHVHRFVYIKNKVIYPSIFINKYLKDKFAYWNNYLIINEYLDKYSS